MSIPGIAGVEVGDVLLGKYRIEEVLGLGGMGVVVAAYHLHLQERVAIKFLLAGVQQAAAAEERFLREARAAVRIKSEHVTRVMDVGKLESGQPYMVMEYLRGHDLEQRLAQQGPLSVVEACDYVLQASEAIAEAHAAGIVHRDLKPANLYLHERPDGSLCVKVLDFGISKLATGAGALTSTATVLGSPLYMSPEQLESARNVDARTDIWALGIILFELLTGEPPFQAESFPELIGRIVTTDPPALRDHCAHAPAGLGEVVRTCLQRDRSLRYQDVAQLAAALSAFASAPARSRAESIARILHGPGRGLGEAARQANAFEASSTAPVAAEVDLRTAGRRPWGARLSLLGLGILLAFAALRWGVGTSGTAGPPEQGNASVAGLPATAPASQRSPESGPTVKAAASGSIEGQVHVQAALTGGHQSGVSMSDSLSPRTPGEAMEQGAPGGALLHGVDPSVLPTTAPGRQATAESPRVKASAAVPPSAPSARRRAKSASGGGAAASEPRPVTVAAPGASAGVAEPRRAESRAQTEASATPVAPPKETGAATSPWGGRL